MVGTAYGAPEASGLSKDSIYSLAESVGAQLKYAPGAPLEPLVFQLGGQIRYQDFWDLESTASGSIRIHGERDFEIYVAAHTGLSRDRFTIAHEIGHYILHFLFPLKQGRPVGPIQAKRYGSGRVEWEANWFAAGLLMPGAAFSKAHHAANGDIISVAEKFGVSVAAAEIRAKSLELT